MEKKMKAAIMGVRVQGLWFRVPGLGLRVED